MTLAVNPRMIALVMTAKYDTVDSTDAQAPISSRCPTGGRWCWFTILWASERISCRLLTIAKKPAAGNATAKSDMKPN